MEWKPARRCVLVADDEDLIRWSLREVLREEGYFVVLAATGLQALERSERADLALVDWQLPDTDGLSVAKALRRRGRYCPVILMTADVTPELFEEAAITGVYRVLPKPFDLDVVLRLVREALDEEHQERGRCDQRLQ
jgi:CheY-like chemotaxis protein